MAFQGYDPGWFYESSSQKCTKNSPSNNPASPHVPLATAKQATKNKHGPGFRATTAAASSCLVQRGKKQESYGRSGLVAMQLVA